MSKDIIFHRITNPSSLANNRGFSFEVDSIDPKATWTQFAQACCARCPLNTEDLGREVNGKKIKCYPPNNSRGIIAETKDTPLSPEDILQILALASCNVKNLNPNAIQ